MIIGIPKEIKQDEYRVGLTPGGVRELVDCGHEVLVETNAGAGIDFSDRLYQEAGASIVEKPATIFERAEMIVKVKEPQPNECKMLREGQTLFTYLHLAADKAQAELLLHSGCTAIAYETVTDHDNRLPLLEPMSEVAGRLSVQAGAHCLEKIHGGRGVLLGGVPGVRPAEVVVIGGGTVGTNAIRIAVGMEAHVTVLDRSIKRLKELDDFFGSRLNTIYSTNDAIEEYVTKADLVIGAVLLPGAAAPKLVTHDLLPKMREGSVIVDVAIDQGGCCETSKPTTHSHPTYVVDGVVHYCVANMPGAVARTSTIALSNATLPYVLHLANESPLRALKQNLHLLNGLNIHQGHVTCEAVAHSLGYNYVPAETIL